jgi:hypothetical protein
MIGMMMRIAVGHASSYSSALELAHQAQGIVHLART